MSENKLGDLDSRPIKFKPTQSKDSCASGICTKLLCPLILSHHGGTLGIPVIRKNCSDSHRKQEHLPNQLGLKKLTIKKTNLSKFQTLFVPC